MDFLKDIVLRRYATKKFDGRVVDENKIEELKEMIRYSASSFGLQPWRIKVIKDQGTKDKLSPATWNQPQITTASHIFVFCADMNISGLIDKLEGLIVDSGTKKEAIVDYVNMMRSFDEGMPPEAKKTWAQKQCYIAVGNTINGAKALGLDSCPMEGFDPTQYTKILELPNNLIPTVIVAVGYAADTPKQKTRFASNSVFF